MDREQIYEAFANGLISLGDIIDISQKDGYNQALDDFEKAFFENMKKIKTTTWTEYVRKLVEQLKVRT